MTARLQVCLLALALALALAVVGPGADPAAAATISVDAAGAGDTTTIQAGLDLAAAGDTVVVWPGTYAENLIHRSGVDLRSRDGADVTTIDGRGGRCFKVDRCGPGTRVSGSKG